ncbi:MAG TPA: TonB-dependent receptor [Thermoanaerobaculia bacterium]|jgi:outer membrane receptor protein involved in Fe transport|nr:TonB-dependent receptor [Thermoanaerobaculia bacterium]
MNARTGGRRRPLVVLLLLFLVPAWAHSFEGRLLLQDGAPAAAYQISVVGQSLSVTAGPDGRFRIHPTPSLPFRLVAVSPGGEVFPAIEVTSLPEAAEIDLTLTAGFRDSITVAAGIAPNIEAPPASATVVLGQEDLEQRRPPRLADALQGVAGASRTDETSTAVPVIRGLAGGRTLILLDGGRVTAERRAGPSASYLDPFTLGSIEVARGPGSVAYGSDALGGVIHARSRYPEPGSPGLSFQLNKEAGAGDEEAAGLEVAHDVPGGALLGQLTWRRAGDQEAGGGELIPNSAYEDRGGALRYTSYTRLGRLRASFSAADALDVGKPSSDVDTVRTSYPKESSRRFNLSLDSGPLAGWETVEVGLFLGRYRLITDRDRAATATALRVIESSDVDADDGSLRFAASRAALGGRLLAGAEVVSRFGLEALTFRDTRGSQGERVSLERTVSIDDARQVDEAVFFTFDRPLAARWLVSTGLRGDRVETRNSGGFFGDRATDHSALSGYAALTAGPFADVTAQLQVARGFRDPLLSDRYFRGPSGRGFITGNPDLDPETSRQIDASVRWARGGRSVALYGYLYRIEDLIERFRPQRDFFFRNRGEAEIKGLELETQTPLPAGFNLEVAAAVARGEARDDGAPLDLIAAPNGSATLRWGGERGFSYLRGSVFLRDERPGPTEVERPGHSVWDLGAGWRITDELEMRVLGRNLTDRRYRDSADEVASLARGRSFSVGLVGRY